MRAIKEVNRGLGGGDGDHPVSLDPNCPSGCSELRLHFYPSCFPRLVNFYAAYMEQSRVSVLRAFLKKKKKKLFLKCLCEERVSERQPSEYRLSVLNSSPELVFNFLIFFKKWGQMKFHFWTLCW